MSKRARKQWARRWAAQLHAETQRSASNPMWPWDGAIERGINAGLIELLPTTIQPSIAREPGATEPPANRAGIPPLE